MIWLFIVAVLLILAAIILMFFRTTYVQTTALVTSESQVCFSPCTILVSYVVDDQPFVNQELVMVPTEWNSTGTFSPGQSFEMYYNPSNPSSINQFPYQQNYDALSFLLFIIAIILMLTAWIYGGRKCVVVKDGRGQVLSEICTYND